MKNYTVNIKTPNTNQNLRTTKGKTKALFMAKYIRDQGYKHKIISQYQNQKAFVEVHDTMKDEIVINYEIKFPNQTIF